MLSFGVCCFLALVCLLLLGCVVSSEVFENLGDLVDDVSECPDDLLDEVFESLDDLVDEIVECPGDLLNEVFDCLGELIDEVVKYFGDLVDEVIEGLDDLADKVFEFLVGVGAVLERHVDDPAFRWVVYFKFLA